MSANFQPKHYYRYRMNKWLSKDAFLCITVTEYKGEKLAVFKCPSEDKFVVYPVANNANEYCFTGSHFIEAEWELIGELKND